MNAALPSRHPPLTWVFAPPVCGGRRASRGLAPLTAWPHPIRGCPPCATTATAAATALVGVRPHRGRAAAPARAGAASQTPARSGRERKRMGAGQKRQSHGNTKDKRRVGQRPRVWAGRGCWPDCGLAVRRAARRVARGTTPRLRYFFFFTSAGQPGQEQTGSGRSPRGDSPAAVVTASLPVRCGGGCPSEEPPPMNEGEGARRQAPQTPSDNPRHRPLWAAQFAAWTTPPPPRCCSLPPAINVPVARRHLPRDDTVSAQPPRSRGRHRATPPLPLPSPRACRTCRSPSLHLPPAGVCLGHARPLPPLLHPPIMVTDDRGSTLQVDAVVHRFGAARGGCGVTIASTHRASPSTRPTPHSTPHHHPLAVLSCRASAGTCGGHNAPGGGGWRGAE